MKDFDCIVRYDPDDPGTLTELKSLQGTQNVTAAMKRSIIMGARQLERHTNSTGGIVDGHVIIDGRDANMTADDAQRACRRVVGQANAHGQKLPKQIRFVLTDTTSRFFDPTVSTDHTGTARFDPPDEHTFRTTRVSDPEDKDERH